MTAVTLHSHPSTPCSAVRALRATVERRSSAQALTFRYQLDGDLSILQIPEPTTPAAADELWRHTCFEAFIAKDAEAYYELNFSPSGQWAAYAFGAYRKRRPWLIEKTPTIEVARTPQQLLLTARIVISDLPETPLRLGLAAVIETQKCGISYWAAHHPGPRPDFHDRAGFVIYK